ncbi:hypothetical protein ACFSX9_10425 [Flavobacterium ardleyense]|uniref:Uncharacterized protein n=1 Tax=Flavobacterium ardleyense TaxID=2038737 RepID=A0ABW5Z9Z8_9FLAO
MEEQVNKPLSYLEKLKLKTTSQQHYGGVSKTEEATVGARTCINCGAGRAKEDGLTKCGYCGFEFLTVKLSDGLHIKKEDNSK